MGWHDRTSEMATQIASILALNEASVGDLPAIFDKVRNLLTVKCKKQEDTGHGA